MIKLHLIYVIFFAFYLLYEKKKYICIILVCLLFYKEIDDYNIK